MTESGGMDLIHLEDPDGNHCIVRVTGWQPGLPTGHDVLHAEVLAHASFVDARLELYLFQHDLDAWQDELSSLVPGTGALIGGDRGLNLDLHMQEDRSLVVTINDPDRLSAMVWIRPPENWIQEHQGRLEQVRQTWLTEVL
ncbi:hypothetical protein Kpho02_21790 [Kitasatospora phosalacinea]|uniref:Uncharacterized protein n=1 Tax=Kitasatospora phosalacinea TaxID=2065 RepID=A0A9W6Q4P0_9ACTN|nr:DUF5959 family protein [Kitasatospora phosalacinea]GLW69880.1 hypothetical protein Kpho02_21790 [Kitasatospora phosalacinea]